MWPQLSPRGGPGWKPRSSAALGLEVTEFKAWLPTSANDAVQKLVKHPSCLEAEFPTVSCGLCSRRRSSSCCCASPSGGLGTIPYTKPSPMDLALSSPPCPAPSSFTVFQGLTSEKMYSFTCLSYSFTHYQGPPRCQTCVHAFVNSSLC